MVLPTDDLGVLREGEESTEDILRKQLLEREREIDRVCRRIPDLNADATLIPSR